MDVTKWQKDRKVAEKLLLALAGCKEDAAKTLQTAELEKMRELLGHAMVIVAGELRDRAK